MKQTFIQNSLTSSKRFIENKTYKLTKTVQMFFLECNIWPSEMNYIICIFGYEPNHNSRMFNVITEVKCVSLGRRRRFESHLFLL